MIKTLCPACLALFLIAAPALAETAGTEERAPYDSKGKRDPFLPLITRHVKAASGLYGVQTINDVALEGIVYDPGGSSIAIFNGVIVRDRDEQGAVRIEKIEEKKVILHINGIRHELALGEEGEG